MKIILRPLRVNPWSGIHKYKNCTTALRSYFTRSGRLYTGLSAPEAEKLGKSLGFDLSPMSNFWSTFTIRIGNNDIILDTSDPYDELRYIFLKSHKRVAIGLNDNKPTADYVLIDENREASESNVRNKLRRKAMKEFDKFSPVTIRKILRIYGHKADNVSDDVAENRLNDLVDRNPQKLFDKWIDNKKREIEFLIQEAIAKNIIRRNKNVYKYGTDIIGHSLDDAVAYLENPANQDLKITIINEANIK